MSVDDIHDDSMDQPDVPNDTAAADEATASDDDTELDDPEFQAVLFYIEKFATKVAKQINAKHGPNNPDTQHESTDAEATTEAVDENPTPEPGTDAYDEIHGIPYYDLE